MQNSRNILVVESDEDFAKVLATDSATKLDVDFIITSSMAEAKLLIEKGEMNFFLAIINIKLPDAPNGEIIDYIISRSIPIVVLTESTDDEIRNLILTKNIIDYVFKHSLDSIDYLNRIIKRISANRNIKVLVVDDSILFRHLLFEILNSQLFTVLLAKDGEEALEIVENNQDIRLVLVDYKMPIMDGFELTIKLRKQYLKDEMAIIAISKEESDAIVSKFLKFGANDYIEKPFSKEELVCRINNTIEHLELIQLQKDMANRDYLTNLKNRRYFYETASILHANACRGNLNFIIAVIDIDNFKSINDKYGHAVGDIVLQDFSQLLRTILRQTDLIARIGGEEFCLLLPNVSDDDVAKTIEKIRKMTSQRVVSTQSGIAFGYTVSIGVCTTLHSTLEDMIAAADEMLYIAKKSGKNKIICDLTTTFSNEQNAIA